MEKENRYKIIVYYRTGAVPHLEVVSHRLENNILYIDGYNYDDDLNWIKSTTGIPVSKILRFEIYKDKINEKPIKYKVITEQ